MLQIVNGQVLRTDDYCITHNENGEDELRWTCLVDDPEYKLYTEEMRILETTEQQTYKITMMNAGERDCTIIATLDLDDFRSRVHINFSSGARKVDSMIRLYALPAGWTLQGTAKSQTLSIEMQGPTDYDILMQCQERYNCCLRFDTFKKIITLIYPDDYTLSNAFAVESVNLRRPPYFKGKSDGIYTRIYPIGKNGLTISSVNGGKAYLDDNSYTEKIISYVWRDIRYDTAQSLKDAAAAKLKEAAQPVRSWTLDVIDLKAVNNQKWPDMDMSIFKRIRLVDSSKGFSSDVQIVETQNYPYYPERNVISVSSVSQNVRKSVSYIMNQIENANSALWQKIGGQ